MLEVKSIKKTYVTEIPGKCGVKKRKVEQKALDGVSILFRNKEFVTILGTSGAGKTTLMNIIGGLDHYDEGDLIINGISTKEYTEKDWNNYRNNMVGFVYQSYNLIEHQTILSNVELALTLSGVNLEERRCRAEEVLKRVGLEEHMHKLPAELSGGQQQRVAIARAIINNPVILLADEPTGALDSETSVQIMELLKEVSKDSLLIMVTHNPELALKYATRTINVKDGKVVSDSNPIETEDLIEAERRGAKDIKISKANMKIGTAFNLSFNNLKMKKARTFLTAFAGAIGIIGIAGIQSISYGVKDYIADLQKDTMLSYPVEISEMAVDLSGMLESHLNAVKTDTAESDVDLSSRESDHIYADMSSFENISNAAQSVSKNDLESFKRDYLDSADSEIHNYVGEHGIVCKYDLDYDIYSFDQNGVIVNTADLNSARESASSAMGSMQSGDFSSMLSMGRSGEFSEILGDKNGEVTALLKENYNVLSGHFPEKANEVVLCLSEAADGTLTEGHSLSAQTFYKLGFLPFSEYEVLVKKIKAGESLKFDKTKEQSLSFDDICGKTFYLLTAGDSYVFDSETDMYHKVTVDNDTEFKTLLKEDKGIELVISGIVQLKTSDSVSLFDTAVGYTPALTDLIMERLESSEVLVKQKENLSVNVLTGVDFVAATKAEKISEAQSYVESLDDNSKISLLGEVLTSSMDMTDFMGMLTGSSSSNGFGAVLGSMMGNGSDMDMRMYSEADVSGSMSDVSDYNTDVLGSSMTEMFDINSFFDDEAFLTVYDLRLSGDSYESNMKLFGEINREKPSSIKIYADSFEDKEGISQCIEYYNDSVSAAEKKIVYTDIVGLLMTSVSSMMDTITYVLIAFVSVALVVSSIMIGIIMYISVLERRKEIGILRALGASRLNIMQIFLAETSIIGLFSGFIGIGATLLLILPCNQILHMMTGNDNVNAILPVVTAVVLIALSVTLTLIGGFIPSRKAAKQDPVLALRSA